MPTGALIAGGIGAAGSLGSAYISSNAAQNAASQQVAAQTQALDFQKQVYQNNQTNLQPWIGTGNNALYSLASLYGLPTPNNPSGGAQATNSAFQAFTQLPSYQFPFQQGSLALSDALNAQGKQQSGAQARETQQFGQGLASQYLMSNYVNPLMQLSGQGQGAASSLAGYGVQSGNQIGSTLGNIGTAQAAGTVGSANAYSGALNNTTNSLGLYSALAYGGNQGGGGTYSLSGPQWGGGNFLSGDAWGGNANNPLPSLTSADYG